MKGYADCSYCGGEVTEQKIDYDYRRHRNINRGFGSFGNQQKSGIAINYA